MIKHLDWDSIFFQLKIGEILFETNSDIDETKDFDLIYIKSRNDFLIKIPNFYLNFSETKLIFVKNNLIYKSECKNIYSFKNSNFNLNDLYDLAFESGKFSRFFLDKNFIEDKFKELYKKWIDNSINESYADDVLIYQENNIIFGFVSFKIKENTATIGLIAVNSKYQGKNIGSKLLQSVENELVKKNIKTLFIPTQTENIQACNFYIKQGYSIFNTQYIKHFWRI